MRPRARLMPLLAASLLLTPAAGGADQPTASSPQEAADRGEGVLALVNGEPVFLEDAQTLLAEMHGTVRPTDRSAFDVDRLMFRLVNDALMAQEARSLGMHEEPPIPERLRALRERLANERLQREEISERLEISEQEIVRMHQDDYRWVTLRILTRSERGEAEAILAELAAGADFATLAREQSQDRFRSRGGLREKMLRIDLPPDLAAQAFSLEPGDLAGPVATSLGWSILRIEGFGEADPEQFEARKSEIRSILRLRQAERLRTELTRTLRELHPIEVDPAVLGSLEPRRIPDGRLRPRIEDPDAVVASVGERTITARELGRALATRWNDVRNEAAALSSRAIVLDRLIEQEMLTAEALRRGYDEAPEVERAVRASENRQLVARVLKEVVQPGVSVTREEMEAYYADHRDEYRKPPLLLVRQLTVDALEEAERLAELARGGADFAWLARQHSTDGFREQGGERGWVPANAGIAGFENELRTAGTGDVLGPKGEEGHYQIVYVSALEDQGLYSFEEVSGNVRSVLTTRESRRVLDDYIKRLRERSEIQIDSEAVAALRITGSREEGTTGMRHGSDHQ